MAAEFVTSAAANTVGNLTTEYASPYVSYFFRFGKIVEEFKKQRNALILKNKRVKNDVDEATRQTEVIEEDVLNWLESAKKELEETQSLEVEIERKKCFNWCPSWGWRYCLSKKVAKKTPYINKLLESSDFQRVGYRAPLQGIEFLPSKDFMPSESSNSAFNEIIKALNTDSVNMIGLYGMPGVGKTTLAKKVENHAKKQKLFDNVVRVTMSQTPNINTIQERIAELLGLKFAASTEEGKAEELCRRLKGVKNLIITDDVWNEFKLQTIGIPFCDEHDGCKILLTTRRQQVCDQMNCQKKFKLDIFSEDEAWALFKDNAGLENVPSRLNDVAKEVACECKGLPLAIVTIGKALKGASLDGWKAANQRLKNSRHLDNVDVCEDIYNRLKLSYDYLKGDNILSCFLLCSLFPEDFDIPIELLIMLGIGYGLFSDISSIEERRWEIREALRKLQDSGLLLKNDDDCVSMHDVVRDFAHWITSKEKNIFMFKERLTEWPISDSCGCYTAISFWDSNINTFPDKLEFRNLKFFVFTGNGSVRVPIALVKGMEALQVLYLRKVVFSLEVLKFITNLRTLCFEDCELENISSLKNVENLEILVLSDTNIYELPEELLSLRRLKSLHFSSSGQCNFPPNLLSRLTSLQELHVTSENNVNLSELNSLSGLTALSLRVSTDQCVRENFVFHKIQSHIIAVNQDLRFMEAPTFRTLKIRDFSSSLSAFKELFCNVEKLALERVMGHKNIVPNVDQEGLKELTSLQLRFCKDLECLIDTAGEQGATAAFSNLVELKMEGLTCFKELCYGPPPIRFLQKLTSLDLRLLPELEQVFDFLQEVAELEENQVPPLSNLTCLELDNLPELKWIWKGPTHLVNLRSLKIMRIASCLKLTYLFSTSLAQGLVHLEVLEIRYCDSLEHLIIELESDYSRCWSKLRTLQISNCKNLKYVFPISLAQGLVHLEVLKIWTCDSLEHLIIEPKSDYSLCWSKLRTLQIMYCKSLKYVFPISLAQGLVHLEVLDIRYCDSLEHLIIEPKSDYSRCWSKLRTLQISNCKNLKYVFPISLAQGLVHLEVLEIQYCDSLKHLIIETESDYFLCRSKLRTLTIMYCKNLKYVFPIASDQGLVHLEVLKIQNCDSLEHLIIEAESDYSRCWSKLRTLQIMNCKSLKYVFPISLAQGLVHLEVLEIRYCDSLEHLIIEPESDYSRCWSKLRTLEISNCKNLKYVFPISLAQGLVHLEVLEIRYCDSLKHLITEAESDYFLCLSKLRTLTIMYCKSLKYVFPIASDQGLVHLEVLKIQNCDSLEHLIIKAESDYSQCWSKLRTLQIMNCKSLKYVFPITLTQGLVHLEVLQIQNCDSLEHLIIEAESYYSLCWSKLRTLQIMYCKSLKYVFPITLAQRFSCLESIEITNSSQLKQVFTMTKENVGLRRQDIVLPRLQILKLENLENLCSFCPENFVMSLKKFEVCNCPRLTQQIITSLQTYLENVRVMNCDQLQEVFQTDDLLHNMEEIQAPLLSNLTSLELQSLPELKWIWKGPSHYVRLQRLKVAEIYRCNRLKYLFSPSLAQSLVLLEQLKVVGCDGLEHITTEMEIDGNIESDSGHLHPPLLPKLTSLKIRSCPRLEYVFKIPLAQGLPHLESICIINAPELKQVFNVAKEKNGVDHDAIALPRLQHLQLENLINLSCVCSENYPFLSPSLQKLTIWDCPRLLHFTIQQEVNKQVQLKELRNLPQLKFLHIELCEELEEIIETDQTSIASSSQGYLQPISFPSLQYIWIHGCYNLKSLFPISVARSLSNLKRINIQGASKLKQVFGYEGELNVEDDKMGIVFPELKEFELLELPSLTSFAPMGYNFQFPSLKHLKVGGCPYLTTSFSKDSKDIVHAITEAPRQVEHNTAEGLTTMEEIVDNLPTCNDISWFSWSPPGTLPLYINVEETEDNVTQ